MIAVQPDAGRAARRRWLRKEIRVAQGAERYFLLKGAGDDIRELTPLVAKASAMDWDMAASLDLAAALGVIIGAWLTAEPFNPDWPFRDRLFLGRRDDLVTAAAAFAIMGFFSPHQAAKLVDQSQADTRAGIPGLEAAALSPEALAHLAWESAVDSGKSKKRWQERFPAHSALSWIDPDWHESPAVWRTCVLVDHNDTAAAMLRGFPARGGETASGLVVMLAANRVETPQLASAWRDSGWEVVTINHDDFLELYEVLSAPVGDKPLAVVLGSGRAVSAARQVSDMGGGLLGELPDEQFTVIMKKLFAW